jgi:hypothetical protein
MGMLTRVLMCSSVAALLGTFAMPPLPEAEGRTQSKKAKRWAAKKKAGGAKGKNCSLGFEPGARKPKKICR